MPTAMFQLLVSRTVSSSFVIWRQKNYSAPLLCVRFGPHTASAGLQLWVQKSEAQPRRAIQPAHAVD
ncbi:hypothetical protein TIFTF001_047680 [Ficus carica]|uniref:Uncharacterized protein n=1 Tax=Ficus carica TaxID=3494 RepID=A0AA87YW34_FICCA|nr:hypothetical protein TIFTF001_047680 [Ficus carica]